jgi:hypothetical protein
LRNCQSGNKWCFSLHPFIPSQRQSFF